MSWSKDTLNAARAAVDGLASAKAPSNRDAVSKWRTRSARLELRYPLNG
jgi:hypothetical protein